MTEVASTDPLLLSVLLAAVLPLGLGLWWQMRRARRASEAQARAEVRTAALEQALGAAPDGWFAWFQDDTPAPDAQTDPALLLVGGQCSRRLAVQLDLYAGRQAVFSDLLSALEPLDAAQLATAARTLRRDGEGFALIVRRGGDTLPGGLPQRLRASGIRAVADDGTALADLIWVRDVSAEEEERTHLSAHAVRLDGERRRLLAAFDALPLPVWVRDASLGMVAANRAFLAAVEAPDTAYLRETERELAAGVAAREIRALAAAARAAGEPRTAAFPVVAGGKRRLVEITEAPLPACTPESEDGGAETATVGLAQDLSRVESLRTTLEREVSSHAAVLERLRVAIAIYGPDTRLRFYNSAFAALWHLETAWLDEEPSYGEILEILRSGRRLPEVADFPAFREAELARFKGSLEPVEDLLHLPDGGTLRRVLAPHPLGGLLATYEDVTDRLVLEAARASLVAVQKETVAHLREAVAVFAADGRLTLYNAAFTHLWRLPPEAVADRPGLPHLVGALPPGFQACPVWGQINALLAAAPAQRQARAGRVERADGALIEVTGVPLPDGGLLVAFQDASDARRTAQALRTPLTTLTGFAEILADGYYGPLNSRQAEYVHGVLDTARGMATIIEDVVELADLAALDETPVRAPVEVGALLAQALAGIRQSARDKGVIVNFDSPPDIGRLPGDERLLRLALGHLLGNAVQHTPPHGQITLAAMRQEVAVIGDAVVFTIADTGEGMDADQQARAFRPFMGGGSGGTSAGLGLPLVKRVVGLHGGTVELVSVPGEGTTVTLTLPA